MFRRLSHFGTQVATEMLSLRKEHEPKKGTELSHHISSKEPHLCPFVFLRNRRDVDGTVGEKHCFVLINLGGVIFGVHAAGVKGLLEGLEGKWA